jgi:murein endopeptidase
MKQGSERGHDKLLRGIVRKPSGHSNLAEEPEGGHMLAGRQSHIQGHDRDLKYFR